jgi:peptidoglycan L-alanyl-D-glutamate endopeptidase CwlK
MFKLSNKSEGKLLGVHPLLICVVREAILISTQDFTVLEGLRSSERQQKLYDAGKSTTLNSRHITGHAVDLAPWPISWDWNYFYPIADAMKEAASNLNVDLEWGGDWTNFPDGPHFQLSRREYE